MLVLDKVGARAEFVGRKKYVETQLPKEATPGILDRLDHVTKQRSQKSANYSCMRIFPVKHSISEQNFWTKI